MQFRAIASGDGQSQLEEFKISNEDTFYFPTIEGEELVFRRKPMPGWDNCPRRQFVLPFTGR